MAAGVYIHIPFCESRCSYCDFATDIYRDAAAVERYVDAVCTEIQQSTLCVSRAGEYQPRMNADDADRSTPADPRHLHSSAAKVSAAGDLRIDTIYFGGGTPSLLQPEQIARIL